MSRRFSRKNAIRVFAHAVMFFFLSGISAVVYRFVGHEEPIYAAIDGMLTILAFSAVILVLAAILYVVFEVLFIEEEK